MYKVYKHQNIETGTIYIGITKHDDVEKRWKGGMGYYSNKSLFNDILYYGWRNFTHEVLVDNIESEQEAIELEKQYIAKYDSYNNGYNGNMGGYGLNTRENFIPTQKQLDFYDKHSRKIICGDKTFKSIRDFANHYNILESKANSMLLSRMCMPKLFYDLKLRYADLDISDYDKYYKLSPRNICGLFPKEKYGEYMELWDICEYLGISYTHTHRKLYLTKINKYYKLNEKIKDGCKARKVYTIIGEKEYYEI